MDRVDKIFIFATILFVVNIIVWLCVLTFQDSNYDYIYPLVMLGFSTGWWIKTLKDFVENHRVNHAVLGFGKNKEGKTEF